MIVFHGSYLPDDVRFLLEVAEIPEISVQEKEALLRSGMHYGATLTMEMNFDDDYVALFKAHVSENTALLGTLVNRTADSFQLAAPAVVVSLARAGTPYGVIIKRLLAKRGLDLHHYSVSIIKGYGLDKVAIDEIVQQHPGCCICFLDGWTGTGSIHAEIKKSMSNWYPDVRWKFGALVDLAGVCDFAATREDILLPSCMLNSTVSGLVSRTVLPEQPDGRHRVRYFASLEDADLSRWYADRLVSAALSHGDETGKDISGSIASTDGVGFNAQLTQFKLPAHLTGSRVKPGLGESTRALIRRGVKEVWVSGLEDAFVKHIIYLGMRKGIPVIERIDLPFRAVAFTER